MTSVITLWKVRSAVRLLLPFTLVGLMLNQSAAQQDAPMHLTLDQAIDLALKQNHSIHLRSLSVDEMRNKKDEAEGEAKSNMPDVAHQSERHGAEERSGHGADAEARLQKRHGCPAQGLLDGDTMCVHGDIHAADRRAENERRRQKRPQVRHHWR